MTHRRHEVKVALLLSSQHVELLQSCSNMYNHNNNQSNNVVVNNVTHEELEALGIPQAAWQRYPQACQLWNHGNVVDEVIVTPPLHDDNDYNSENNKDHNNNNDIDPQWLSRSSMDQYADLTQGTAMHQLAKLGSYRHAPYQVTIFLDSDAYPCPGVEKLFAVASSIINHEKLWQFPIRRPADIAIGMEQYPKDGTQPIWNPGRQRQQQQHKQGTIMGSQRKLLWHEYESFATRNTGVVLFRFQRPVTWVFAEFLPLVGQHLYQQEQQQQQQQEQQEQQHVVAATTETTTRTTTNTTPTTTTTTERPKIPNDQVAFKVALFVFKRLFSVPSNSTSTSSHDFVEQQWPMHVSCRTYPGFDCAGTDGFLNGMFPLQSNGKHCNECHCTPCLVSHTVRKTILSVCLYTCVYIEMCSGERSICEYCRCWPSLWCFFVSLSLCLSRSHTHSVCVCLSLCLFVSLFVWDGNFLFFLASCV